MYLVGLTLQAAVLGTVIALGLAYEDPIRSALSGGEAITDTDRMDEIDGRIDALAAQVDAIAGAVLGPDPAAADAAAGTDEAAPAPAAEGLVGRLDAVERLVIQVDAKLDGVRGAQPPAQAPAP